MSRRRRVAIAALVMISILGSACGLDDGGEGSTRTEAQVALRSAVAKGCVPVPGVNNAEHARAVVAALDWQLDISQLEALSTAARNLHARRSEHAWLRSL